MTCGFRHTGQGYGSSVLLALVILGSVAGAVGLCILLALGLWQTSRAECQRLVHVPRLISPPPEGRRR